MNVSLANEIWGRLEMMMWADNFELATDNSESENDNESLAEIDHVSNRKSHDVSNRSSFYSASA